MDALLHLKPELILQALSVSLQGVVTVLFAASFIVALRNLHLFRNNHNATLIKYVLDEYKMLVAEDVFSRYPEELTTWKSQMEDTSFSPSMSYYTRLNIIARIGSFYEYVGLLVDKRLLDFNLCYEVLPMPYKFWQDMQEFRAIMKQVTYKQFWDYFENLHHKYIEERTKRNAPPPLMKLSDRLQD